MIRDDIKTTAAFTARNIKVFFKDKGTLISALIAPLIILMLYILFLDGVLKDSFTAGLGELTLSDKAVNGYVAAYEVSSILSVCCITVAFIANMAMVEDRVSGVRADITVTPAKGRTLVLGYYFSTLAVTLAINYITMGVGFIYLASSGWYMSALDALGVIGDVFLSTMFGTALSSVVCYFIRSRGAINAVSTIVSSVYGFICGAYYPIAQFSSGIANAVMCLPGTYCTALFRTHFFGGFADAFAAEGLPAQAAKGILDGFDAHFYFFGSSVSVGAMFAVVMGATVALIAAFVIINALCGKRRTPKPFEDKAERK